MIVNSVVTITAAAQKMTPINGIYKTVIAAAIGNAGIIYVGDSSAQDFPLEEGNALDLPVNAFNQLYVRGTDNDELVILGIG